LKLTSTILSLALTQLDLPDAFSKSAVSWLTWIFSLIPVLREKKRPFVSYSPGKRRRRIRNKHRMLTSPFEQRYSLRMSKGKEATRERELRIGRPKKELDHHSMRTNQTHTCITKKLEMRLSPS